MDMNQIVHEIKEFPPMESGSPIPSIKEIGSNLLVSYICNNPDFPGWDSGSAPDHPGFDEYCAVIKFSEISWYHFGGPSDEKLHQHPLYDSGLTFYGFHVVENSSKTNSNQSHWIITFHDETLEILARNVEVVSKRVDTSSPEEAISMISEQLN